MICASGCTPGPGPCDREASLELVYAEDGTPAFAGQSIVQLSCGNGGFCHSAGIDARDRWGAPAGLELDVRIASTSSAARANESERLRDNVTHVLGLRGRILEQIRDGHMPPGGEAGADYRCQTVPSTCGGERDSSFDRVEADGVSFSPVPTLLDEGERREEAEEIVRNWLACGTPVVERTVERADGEENVIGFTAASCERECVDLTWTALYEHLIAPSCTSSGCHDGDDPAGRLDLSTVGADGVYARIVARPAVGVECGPDTQEPDAPGHLSPTVVPSDPAGSLLYLKVAAERPGDVCGSRMPLSGNPLSTQRLCALRAWIECGACRDDGDPACESCVDAARPVCDVDVTTANGCRSTARCASHALL